MSTPFGFRSGAVGYAPLLEWRQITTVDTLLLIVVVSIRNVTDSVVTVVTFGATPMVGIRRIGGNTKLELWALQNPPANVIDTITVIATGTDRILGVSSVWDTNRL